MAGFWEPFLTTVDHLVATGFLRPEYRGSLLVTQGTTELLAAIRDWQLPQRKWNARGIDEDRLMTSVRWLHVRDGRLLVVRTRDRDAFYLPGGKTQPGEIGSQAWHASYPKSSASPCIPTRSRKRSPSKTWLMATAMFGSP